MFGPPGCEITTPFMTDLRKMYILGAPQGCGKAGQQYSFAATAANIPVSEHGDCLLFYLVRTNNHILLKLILDEFSRQTTFGDERGAGGKVHPGDCPNGFMCEKVCGKLTWMRWKEEKAPKWVWVKGESCPMSDSEDERDHLGRPKIPDPAKYKSRAQEHDDVLGMTAGSWVLKEYGTWERVGNFHVLLKIL